MDIDELRERQKKLWLFSEQQELPDYSWEMYKEIEVDFYLMTRTEHRYHYDYIRFCLRYLIINSKRAYIIFRSLYGCWLEIYSDESFPDKLLTELFDLLKNNTFHYIDFNKLAKCADILFEHGKCELAVLYYEVLENKHTNENSWDYWAEYYSKVDDFETAISILERGLRQIPDSDFIACNLAFYLTRLEKYETALQYLSHVIKQTEHLKFSDNNNYNYATKLKAGIYVDLDKPLHCFMENSRLLATQGCTQNEIIETSRELLNWASSR